MEDNVVRFNFRPKVATSDDAFAAAELQRLRSFNHLVRALVSGEIPLSPPLPYQKD